MSMIDPAIQSNFSSFLYSTSQSEVAFQSSKRELIDSIEAAMLQETDESSLEFLQVMMLTVELWVYPEDEVDAPPPSEEMRERLEEAAEFIMPDLQEIFTEIRKQMAAFQKFLQELQIQNQQQEIKTAVNQKETAESEAANRRDQGFVEGAMNLIAGAAGCVASGAGIGLSIKATAARKQADGFKEQLSDLENDLNKKKDLLKSYEGAEKDYQNELDLRLALDKDRTLPQPAKEPESADVLRAKIKQNNEKSDEVRTQITIRKSDVEIVRRKLSDAERQCDIEYRVAQLVGQVGSAISTFATAFGRLIGAHYGYAADMDRANVQYASHQINIFDSASKAFEQFAQLMGQSMQQAVTDLNQCLQSEASLAQHMAQNVTA